jgi:hypothetical protein
MVVFNFREKKIAKKKTKWKKQTNSEQKNYRVQGVPQESEVTDYTKNFMDFQNIHEIHVELRKTEGRRSKANRIKTKHETW